MSCIGHWVARACAVGRVGGSLAALVGDHGGGVAGWRGMRLFGSSSSSELGELEEREKMPYDVAIVGAGPAGLAAAIRIKQLAPEASVCVLEKGSEVGAHSISGNVFDPRALEELLPGWREMEGVPVRQEVTKDVTYFMTSNRAFWVPCPPTMQNKGKGYVISLSALTRWLAAHAEENYEVDIFPGFAASEVLYDGGGSGGAPGRVVRGVATADMGISKEGAMKDTFARGIELRARVTLFGEGCRGSLSEQIKAALGLQGKANADPQTYGLGIKEVWQVSDEKHNPGEVWHTAGHPFDSETYGGGFLYHMEDNMVALGLVVGLDYKNPYLTPFKEFQRFKLHPKVRSLLEGGQCLQYGARTLVEGGWQSLPFSGFEGGALIGCAAGTLNAARIKGVHTAMKSGMVAAEVVAEKLKLAEEEGAPESEGGEDGLELPPLDMTDYDERLRKSWVGEELYAARNFRPSFGMGLYPGMIYAALDAFVFKGRTPWTFRHSKKDNECLERADSYAPISYPSPDGEITFDIPTSLYRSGTNHDHDQPAHLKLRDDQVVYDQNMAVYDGPETRYCPAGVYEYVEDEEAARGEDGPSLKLQINAQNCLHCKACDIKDPTQNICWTVPEGGGGPSYTLM
ncbi:electron transfer flavoprotein-ubiquinone oxidoreductase [Chloropicon primus]|uniref:Electron transfer flavoprotein-ubiquinone oxidoreductase n=2 Tax=Chloropicon primus TaxID=1764295 RepID=A0A5B8MJF8_9CHLO|nr:electron transfer flavoprotein-ubiquinone oxidoreductase [Chloropicon primus]UPQ99620.1 electron transfer flavoprotein-ubiquinone oxidoreductase [Chloropicon primus]|eukprot:QDZ20411.1 electron transfer flavoprotein-ubiquinone oxidoreductase [Chloropicon primus]